MVQIDEKPVKKLQSLETSFKMDNAIKASNLTKYYGKFLAVDHVSFEVKSGEVFGFLGPNGAGKTTTIRMLTGVSIPTEGTATIMGYDIRRQSVSAKEQMGIVPDVNNVYKDLSAWDNLIFTGKLYDMPKAFSILCIYLKSF